MVDIQRDAMFLEDGDKKYLASIKIVRNFAPLFEREKAVLFSPIETHGEVGEWLKPTVC